MNPEFDERLDLIVECEIDAPPTAIWAAWTRPEHVPAFFVPPPVTITECEIDLRPGGVFRFVMRTPGGGESVGIGCYLEIVPERRLVWTDALLPGFRPAEQPFITMIVTVEPLETGTRCTILVKHRDEAERGRHLEMGFMESSRQILAQLAAHAETLHRQGSD